MLRGAPLLIAFISKVLSKHMFNLQKRSWILQGCLARGTFSRFQGTSYLYILFLLAMRYGWYVLLVLSADLARNERQWSGFVRHAMFTMFLLNLPMYYPSTSKKVLSPQQKKIVKPPLSQWYSYEKNLDMKSTSWIGTHDKESLV